MMKNYKVPIALKPDQVELLKEKLKSGALDKRKWYEKFYVKKPSLDDYPIDQYYSDSIFLMDT